MKELTNVYGGIPTLEDTFYTLLSQFDTQLSLALTNSHHTDRDSIECEYMAMERMCVINTTFYIAGLVKERLSDRISELIAFHRYKELRYIIKNLESIIFKAMCN